MKRIKYSLLALLLVLAGLWLLADTLLPRPFTYFSFRTAFVQFSGIIAIGAMSVAMLLAIRPKWLGTIEGWLRGQRGVAEFLGEWTFYAAVILIALALVKRFPYHLFTRTHKWLAALYLVLVYHSVVLTKTGYWSQPIGWAIGVLMLIGVWAALVTLSGRIGAGRRSRGHIESLTYYPELRVLETKLRMGPGWAGHRAGQFAFVTSDAREGAHPYTIASSWDPGERHMVFITKVLGDHTRRLRDHLKIGMDLTVEGPYGCFHFDDGNSRQIWIGAGIGITPFVARMKQLAPPPCAYSG